MELQEVGKYEVEPFGLERILELRLIKKVNEHAKLSLRGVLKEGCEDSMAEDDWEEKTITLKEKGVVLVYTSGQEKLNNLYYQVKEQRRCSTWLRIKNLTLRNSSSRSWICIMPEEPRIRNSNVNMA